MAEVPSTIHHIRLGGTLYGIEDSEARESINSITADQVTYEIVNEGEQNEEIISVKDKIEDVEGHMPRTMIYTVPPFPIYEDSDSFGAHATHELKVEYNTDSKRVRLYGPISMNISDYTISNSGSNSVTICSLSNVIGNGRASSMSIARPKICLTYKQNTISVALGFMSSNFRNGLILLSLPDGVQSVTLAKGDIIYIDYTFSEYILD